MITTKKRQEFRIKLQKRARRRAEKKIEILEEDRQLRDVSIGGYFPVSIHISYGTENQYSGLLRHLDYSLFDT